MKSFAQPRSGRRRSSSRVRARVSRRANALNHRAQALATTLGAIPRASFRLTKRALRDPHIEALQRHGAAMDEDVLRVWQSAETLNAIRSYLERTFGQR
jgi:hypothetical protein